jgi:secondary thiamine-phosphate synthase enzyme
VGAFALRETQALLAPTSAQRYAQAMLRQCAKILSVRAGRPGLHDFTDQVRAFVAGTDIREGLLTLFCRHTSASLIIQENAAPAARRDLEAYFTRIAPENGPYEHYDEGPDDMPAHLRAALTATQLSIPVMEGKLLLGTWQGIFLFEHRRSTPEREVALHLVGE